MISRTPDQRRHYDARLKWELDESTRIQSRFSSCLHGYLPLRPLRLCGEALICWEQPAPRQKRVSRYGAKLAMDWD
jgi:hypothetical protein